MKRILITGKNSYIGESLENWLSKSEGSYSIDTIDMRDESWRNISFRDYDVIFHVAGIAHVSSDPKQKALYYKVNRDLAIDTAKKAKKEGVKQFIFMSSMIVYGSKQPGGKITKDSIPNPDNFYGDSKLQAEEGLRNLEDDNFKIVIVRPPMIYGEGSKGNYPRLAQFAKKSPIFPNYPNKRSMLHIDNLAEFLKQVIDRNEKGIFFPQNKEYVCTSEMVQEIANVHNKKIYQTKLFNPFITLFYNINIINKVFGDLVYDRSISEYDFNYCVNDFRKTIIETEDVG